MRKLPIRTLLICGVLLLTPVVVVLSLLSETLECESRGGTMEPVGTTTSPVTVGKVLVSTTHTIFKCSK